MTIRLKPIRRPRMTLRDERAQAFRAAERLCGTPSQHIRFSDKPKKQDAPKETQ